MDAPAKTYIHHFCAESGWSLKDPLSVTDDKDGWGEIVREHMLSVRLDYDKKYLKQFKQINIHTPKKTKVS